MAMDYAALAKALAAAKASQVDDVAMAANRMQQAQQQDGGEPPGIFKVPVLGGALQGGAQALGAVTGAPGIHQLLEAMGLPSAVLSGILASGQLSGRASNPFESVAQGLGRLGSRTAQYGPAGALGAARDDWEEVPFSPASFVTGAALDPLTYMGLGIPGKVGKLLPKGRLQDAALAADALEKSTQGAVGSGVHAAFDKAVEAARAGTKVAGRFHPWFGTLLDEAPEARLAAHNSDAVRMMGGMANLLGEDVGGRVLADLYRDPADPRYGKAFERVSDVFRGMGIDLGPETVPTALSQIPGFDSGFAEHLGGRTAKLYDRYDRDLARAHDLINLVYPTGTRPESLAEAVAFAQHHAQPTEHATLQQIANAWKGTDLLRGNEDQVVMSRYMRQVAADEGVHTNPLQLGQLPGGDQLPAALQTVEPGTAWKNALLAWRQQALFWPSYFMGNLGDAATFNAAKMGKLGMGDLGHNVSGVLGHLAQDSPTFDQFFQKFQRPYQYAKEASHQMGPHWQEFADRVGLGNVLPPEITQAGLVNDLGGLKGLEGREPMALERVPKVGRLVRLSREMNEAVELTARSSAYMHGYQTALEQAAPHTEARLGELADHVSPAAGRAIRAHVASVDGVINPRKVAEWFQAQGADDNIVGQALREAGGIQTDAYHAGVDFSHASHINYAARTNLDQRLRNVTGFHFWATRNVPRYTELMATHPGMFRALAGLEDESDEYRQENEIHSPRLQGTVPLGVVGRFLADHLFGKPGELFADPRRAVSISQIPGADVVRPARGETGLGQVLDHLSAVGISPHPFLQAPLEVAGIYGARQPGNVLRATPTVNAAVQAATGNQFDLEGPVKALRRSRPFGGETPANPEEMVRWRLRELSQAETGDPNNQDYNRVPPGSPLWRRAVRDLGDRNLRENLIAMGGVPLKLYTDAEHALDMRRRPNGS